MKPMAIGYLLIQARTAHDAVPLSGVQVRITDMDSNTLYVLTTDENGETVSDDAESSGENAEVEKTEPGFSPEFEIEARSFAKGRQYPDAQLEEGLSLMREIGMAWIDSALTVEMLEVLIRGLDYERAVAQAAEEGEIRGRNIQIDEKYMRPDDSDGLPHLPGKGNVGRGSRGVSSIFDLARDAG